MEIPKILHNTGVSVGLKRKTLGNRKQGYGGPENSQVDCV